MIAIILVNWNGITDTIECLESLLRMSDQDFVIVVVDNRSSDNSVDRLVRWAASAEPPKPSGAPWVLLPDKRVGRPKLVHIGRQVGETPQGGCNIILVTADKNLGFAGGNNLGIAVARTYADVSHVWLLNNDTVVDPSCLSNLKALAKSEPSAAFIGSRLMYYAEPDRVQGVGGYFRPWLARGGHLGHGMKVSDLPDRREIELKTDYVMGASLFLSTDILEKLSPMAEDYFLYFEELDWARRLGPGPRNAICLDAVIYHKEGGSIGTSSLTRPSDTSLYYLHTNLLRYMWKFHRPLIGLAVLRIAREALNYLIPFDGKALTSLFCALWDRIIGVNRSGPISW